MTSKKKGKPMTPKRAPSAKTKKQPTKTTKGRGGVKSLDTFNWKRALPIIIILAVVGSALVFQSFASAPNSTTSQGGATLKTIYADQFKPTGLTSNPYLRESIYTDFKTTPIKPFYSQTTQRWESGWPEKIIVCAILYNEGPGVGSGVETTVSLDVFATGTYKKVQVLEKLPKLPSKLYPKYEVCSDVIPKTYVSPAAPGRPASTVGKNESIGLQLDMVNIVRKNPDKPYLPAEVLKQYKWDTSPNEYYVRLEQYIIKNAENNAAVQTQNANPTTTPSTSTSGGSQNTASPNSSNDANNNPNPSNNEETHEYDEELDYSYDSDQTPTAYESGEEEMEVSNMPEPQVDSGVKSKRWWPW